MSMAIVCMVKNTRSSRSNHSVSEPVPSGDTDSGELENRYQDYRAKVLGGWLSDRFGGKYILGLGLLTAALANMLIPIGARYSPYIVIALRAIMGVSQGGTFPALISLWGAWAPPLESSKLITVCFSGTMLGSIVTLSSAGFLCSTDFAGGWPLVFYVIGSGSIAVACFWFVFVYNTPSVHPCMKEEERKYILSVTTATEERKRKVPFPWLAMLTSRPLWAIVIAHTCDNWGVYMLLTSLPKYMEQVLQYDIRMNGLLSALPYIVQLVAVILGGQVADSLRQHEVLSTTATRKTFQLISFAGQCTFMVATGFVSSSQRNTAVTLLAVGVGFNFGSRSGYIVNGVDIAPKYAGILFGITNSIASLPGIIAPIVVAKLTPNGLREEWQSVFYITGGVFTIGAVMYVVFASGEEQEWAKEIKRRKSSILAIGTFGVAGVIRTTTKLSSYNNAFQMDEENRAGPGECDHKVENQSSEDIVVATKF